MQIANPIYDAVFKFLLEDLDIAKGLIGAITGLNIVDLQINEKEVPITYGKGKTLNKVLRIDFGATVKSSNGDFKKILIELQKSSKSDDIPRFRYYLGTNYRRKEQIQTTDGKFVEDSLPIVAIYILGFPLVSLPETPVIKVERVYLDLITGKTTKKRHPFVEKLTHDGYFIQVKYLERSERTELEGILKVFNQSYTLKKNNAFMSISKSELKKYPLLEKIGDRLAMAVSEPEIVEQIIAQQEHDKWAKDLEETIAEKEEVIAEKEEVIVEKDEVIAEKDEVIAEKEKDTDKAIAQLIKMGLKDKEIATILSVTMKRVKTIRKEHKN